MYNDYLLEDLVDMAKSGDREAMEEILKRFKWLALKLCNRTYIKGWDLDDLMQVTNMALMRSVQLYKKCGTSFPAYVKTAMKRELFYRIRQSLNKPSYCSIYSKNENGDELVNTFVSENEDYEGEKNFLHKEKIKFLKKAIGMLSEKERDLIEKYFFEGISLKKYAIENDMSYRNAVYIKRKALKKLKEFFNKFYK
ncbi:sigma-70 family RNA polymerase sigma factor [Clostridium sp. cel8]|jgi:RNA polymerase sporulation-specific sigma factor|uniref:sigma-70 family RNA polymerase sigma factor n=2 Tax=unclassified Clostridium TaxID=2614128 RepID=UPI0015F48002|nr:sigma-70 family RNA polymerase sigma factor [Clostridium sp. cel8]MBA5850043.1 sigma-70 family RNA polymerase sigma factor [Clostridium sp. cel8]